MSTSISLTISAENIEANAAKTSKSFGESRRSNTAKQRHQKYLPPNALASDQASDDELIGRRHTGLGSAGAGQTFLDVDAAKLRRWRQQPRGESLSDSNGCNDEIKAGNFYEEVDDRMSRNSLEYPDQQARYIDKWLAQSGARHEPSTRSKSFDNDSAGIKGNVVGIRGFSSDSHIGDSRYIRKSHGRLKREHASLQADYDKLKSHFDAAARNSCRTWKRNEHDLDLLKALVVKQGQRLEVLLGQHEEVPQQFCDICRKRDGPKLSSRTLNDEDWQQIKDLELRLALREQEYANNLERMKSDNERLMLALASKDHELDNFKNELRQMSLEPQNRQLVRLQQDNLRMRDSSERERAEYQRLKANCDQLEAQLRSLVEDQKFLGDEQNDELSGVLVELCRLQVYQPKLEMTLETERKIKLELGAQIERLQGDKAELSERLASLERELRHEKVQRKALETQDIERARAEVTAWQERCQRLKEERDDLQQALRASRLKVAEADANMSDRLESVRDSCRGELELAAENIRRLECEKQKLVTRLDEASEGLTKCQLERDSANRELVKLHHELALATNEPQQRERPSVGTVSNQLQLCETKCLSLERRLKSLEARNHELQAELKLAESKEIHSKQQLGEQKRRFALQQKTFDELKERKEKELAKLRNDLNYEQYNRQISLRGIEKELRLSLKELESMKCRFSKRPSARHHESICDTTLASERSVQLDDETPQAQTATTTASTMRDNTRGQQRFETACRSIRDPETESEEQEPQPVEHPCAQDRERQSELAQ